MIDISLYFGKYTYYILTAYGTSAIALCSLVVVSWRQRAYYAKAVLAMTATAESSDCP